MGGMSGLAGPQENKGLDYFISQKDGYVVVCFIGAMSRTTTEVLELCQKELLETAAANVVLSFHYVSEVEVSAFPPLVKLQRTIRDRAQNLRVCQLKPEIKKLLLQAAAIRFEELFESLSEALHSFVTEKA